MATVTSITAPSSANTTTAIQQVSAAYIALNTAMRVLLDDQGAMTSTTAAATAPTTATAAPTPPMLGFETIDKEIKVLYSAIAQISKVHSQVLRRSKFQNPANK